MFINFIDYFARRQSATECVGNFLRGEGRQWCEEKIFIRANGEIVGCDEIRGSVGFSVGDVGYGNWTKLAQEFGNVAVGNFGKDFFFARLQIESGDAFGKLASRQSRSRTRR